MPSNLGEQLSSGRDLYVVHCATCHGENGSGGDSPPVVGPDALPVSPPKGTSLRTVRFRSAADVASFVREKMPPGRGGALTKSQYYAIVAYLLDRNDIQLEEPLGSGNAPRIDLAR